jgi:hypothetical protein
MTRPVIAGPPASGCSDSATPVDEAERGDLQISPYSQRPDDTRP